MMKHRATGLVLLAGTALFGLGLATGVAAADVGKLVEDCANCHGKDGASTDKDIPIIGGNSVAYITSTFANYKNKDRPCPEAKYVDGPNKGKPSDMCKIAKELSDGDVKQIAEYFAAKPFVRAKGQTFDAALAKKGDALHEKYCKKCHADGGSLATDDSGMLAGQWTPVLKQQFKEFSEGTRPMEKKMKAKYEKLEPADIEALIHYYASFK